jgi:threonine/homoserine/homoserine lactone efflux protein
VAVCLEGIAVFGVSGLILVKLSGSALVVSLSPIPIALTLVLLIHNDRPHSSSIAYLLGRLISLSALTTAFVRVPRLLDRLDGSAPRWINWVFVAVGTLLVVLGARLWWLRARATNKPRWEDEDRVARITPTVSAVIGIFTGLANPKVVAVSAAVGTEIATLHSTVVGAVVAVAYYAVLANSTVAAPILAYLVTGPRIDPLLKRIRHWIQTHHQAMTGTVLVIVGSAAVLYGVGHT